MPRRRRAAAACSRAPAPHRPSDDTSTTKAYISGCDIVLERHEPGRHGPYGLGEPYGAVRQPGELARGRPGRRQRRFRLQRHQHDRRRLDRRLHQYHDEVPRRDGESTTLKNFVAVGSGNWDVQAGVGRRPRRAARPRARRTSPTIPPPPSATTSTIAVTGSISNPGDFIVSAYNDVEAYDSVDIDAGGAIAGAGVVSEIRADTNNATAGTRQQ